MQLRPYQQEARSAIQKEWTDGKKKNVISASYRLRENNCI